MLSYAARQYSMKGALGTVPNPMTALSISKYLHLSVLSELREPGGNWPTPCALLLTKLNYLEIGGFPTGTNSLQ
jgi:hypothetical protein